MTICLKTINTCLKSLNIDLLNKEKQIKIVVIDGSPLEAKKNEEVFKAEINNVIVIIFMMKR